MVSSDCYTNVTNDFCLQRIYILKNTKKLLEANVAEVNVADVRSFGAESDLRLVKLAKLVKL